MSLSRAEIEAEIKKFLGIVPSFFNRIPDNLLDFEWQLFQYFELETPISAPPRRKALIPAKYRQLMGVTLHSETKCEYCIFFHSELAKLFGATDEEVQEAVHYAKHSAGWSAYINGVQTNFGQFVKEVKQIGEYLQARV